MALGATEKKLDHLHWPLVLCTLIICSLGVWNLASATKNAPVLLAMVQARSMGIGLVAVAVLLFIDYRWLQTLAWPGYVAALGLLAGVAFAGK
jgi:rod shape determining protein RodA